MKSIYYFIILVMLAAISSGRRMKPYYDLNNAPQLFEKFIRDYNKHYKNDTDKMIHYLAFVKALQIINKGNAENTSGWFDINPLADLTEEEFHNMNGGPRIIKGGIKTGLSRLDLWSKVGQELIGDNIFVTSVTVVMFSTFSSFLFCELLC